MAKSAGGVDTHTKRNVPPSSSLLSQQSLPSIKTQYVSLHTDTLSLCPQHTHTPSPNQQGRTLLCCGKFIKTAVGLPWLRALHQVEVGGRQQAGRFFLALPEDHQLEQESSQSAATNSRGRGRSPGSCGLIITESVAVLVEHSPAGFLFCFVFFCFLSSSFLLKRLPTFVISRMFWPPAAASVAAVAIWMLLLRCWSANVQTRSPG